MKKKNLIDAIAEQTDLTKKDTNAFLDAFVDVVKSSVSRGEKVFMYGFGTFETTLHKGREMKNPKTGKKMEIPSRIVPKFRVSTTFRDEINGE